MAKTCIKCGYTRTSSDAGPDYACPACGVVYAKAEALAAQAAAARARTAAIAAAARARAAQDAGPSAQQEPADGPEPAATARAQALVQQFAIAQASQRRAPSPYKGMALVVLIAFSVGFASAAGLYAGAAKFSKKVAEAKCQR